MTWKHFDRPLVRRALIAMRNLWPYDSFYSLPVRWARGAESDGYCVPIMSRPGAIVSILLADDHPLIRKAVVDLLASASDLEVVAACAHGVEALQALQEKRPNLALLDVRMPETGGLEILAFIRENELDTKVILLTATINDSELLDAISLGARGVLIKDALPEELVRCIREVAAGGRYLPEEIVQAARGREQKRRDSANRQLSTLTEREREIASCVAEGDSNKAIAHRLNISEGTVKIHLHNIYQKLSVANRTSLTAKVVSQATLSSEPARTFREK